MKNRDDRPTPRPSISRDVSDRNAGDEGLDQDMSASSLNDERSETKSRSRKTNVRSDDVRDAGSIEREHTERSSSGGFQGQGGQKGGNRGSEEGTGYTSDRTGQLQDEDSRSADESVSDKRQGKSRTDRVGGQTAQNPRDIDRSNM